MLKTRETENIPISCNYFKRGKGIMMNSKLRKITFYFKDKPFEPCFAGWHNSFEKLDRKCHAPQFQRNIVLCI